MQIEKNITELSYFNFLKKKRKKKDCDNDINNSTYDVNCSTYRNVVFNKISSGKTPQYFPAASGFQLYTWYKPYDRTNKTGTSTTTAKQRETIPLPERKGGQLAVTRRTCLDQLSDAAAAVHCIASLHRAVLLAHFEGIAFINAHDSPAGFPQRAASYKLPFIWLFLSRKLSIITCKQFLFNMKKNKFYFYLIITFINCYKKKCKILFSFVKKIFL